MRHMLAVAGLGLVGLLVWILSACPESRKGVPHGPDLERSAVAASAPARGPAPSDRATVLAPDVDVPTNTRALEVDVVQAGVLGERRAAPGGVLGGRILDLAGRPVRGLSLRAEPVGRAPESTTARIVDAERKRGLRGDRTTTDTEGAFRFEVQAPGSYVLFGEYSQPLSSYFDSFLSSPGPRGKARRPLSAASFPTGTRDLVLRIEVHRIEVSVLDGGGRPLDPAQGVERGSDDSSTGVLTARDGPALSCVPIEDEEPLEGWNRCIGTMSGDTAVFGVQPDRTHAVTWADPRYPLQEQLVDVPWETFLVPVRFELPEPTGDTYLHLNVQTPDGLPFEGNNQVQVFSSNTGKLIASSWASSRWGDSHRGSYFSTALPPGAYRVRVSAEPFTGCVVQYPRRRAPHAPVELDLEIPPGVVTEREVRLAASGELALEPLEPRAKPDRGILEELRSRTANVVEGVEDAARERFDGRAVRLTSLADGSVLPIEFETLDLGSLLWRGAPWVVRGYEARSLDPIPPGRYRLRIGGADDPLLERTIEIDAGATTTVVW